MLLLTTPMYTMLYIIHMPGLVATVDYTHVLLTTQCCTLYTCQVLLLLLTTPMYTMLYIIHMPGLVATVDCTQCCTLYTCQVLLLLLTTPMYCCTLYTCQVLLLLLTTPMYTMLYIIHMPGLVATVDYTHVHNAVHYTHARSCCYC